MVVKPTPGSPVRYIWRLKLLDHIRLTLKFCNTLWNKLGGGNGLCRFIVVRKALNNSQLDAEGLLKGKLLWSSQDDQTSCASGLLHHPSSFWSGKRIAWISILIPYQLYRSNAHKAVFCAWTLLISCMMPKLVRQNVLHICSTGPRIAMQSAPKDGDCHGIAVIPFNFDSCQGCLKRPWCALILFYHHALLCIYEGLFPLSGFRSFTSHPTYSSLYSHVDRVCVLCQ